MSQFSDFLEQHGLTPENIVASSAALEALDLDARTLLNQRASARAAKKTYEEAAVAKPVATGRGASLWTAGRAAAGKPIPRVARKKLLRAVNANLASAKKDPTDIRALFGDTPAKKGKKKKKK